LILAGQGSRCPTHKREAAALYNRSRGPEQSFYSSTRWKKFRQWIRAARVACECRDRECACRGACQRPGAHVDHLEPLRQRPDLALVEDAVQVLCSGCHSSKTRRGR
jgi:hypothetical protein